MELELVEKKDLQLLSRVEVIFKVKHPNESTPKRDDVREELATQMKVKKNNVIIDHMESDFGKTETKGLAKIYKSDKEAIDFERDHILVRNKLKTKETKKAEEKKEKSK